MAMNAMRENVVKGTEWWSSKNYNCSFCHFVHCFSATLNETTGMTLKWFSYKTTYLRDSMLFSYDFSFQMWYIRITCCNWSLQHSCVWQTTVLKLQRFGKIAEILYLAPGKQFNFCTLFEGLLRSNFKLLGCVRQPGKSHSITVDML